MSFDFTNRNTETKNFFHQMLGNTAIRNIPISRLYAYENQPFQPYTDEKLKELAQDIAQNGVLSPVIVRPMENDTYQILAGHNRTSACKLNGMTEVPCIVKSVDEQTAKLIVVNSNLNQRHDLLPSEKAHAYKMQYEVLKSQGKRNDLLETNHAGIEQLPESARQVRRYIRLTYLIKPLLNMVDQKQIGLHTAVTLSYLSQQVQTEVLEFMHTNDIKTISLAQSEQLRKQEKLEVVFGLVKKPKASVSIKIPSELLKIDNEHMTELLKNDKFVVELSKLINNYIDAIHEVN